MLVPSCTVIGVVINTHTHEILRIIYPDRPEELDDPLHVPVSHEVMLRVEKSEFDKFGLLAYQQILYAKRPKMLVTDRLTYHLKSSLGTPK